MQIQRKVAIITGASRGIGEGLVKAYRERNFRVVATSRTIQLPPDDDIVTVQGESPTRRSPRK